MDQDAWRNELVRLIERNDVRKAFVWTAVATLVAGSFVSFRAALPLAHDSRWWMALGFAVFIFAGAPFVDRLYVKANPSWTERSGPGQGQVATSFIRTYGFPHSVKLRAWASALIFLCAGIVLLQATADLSWWQALLPRIVGVWLCLAVILPPITYTPRQPMANQLEAGLGGVLAQVPWLTNNPRVARWQGSTPEEQTNSRALGMVLIGLHSHGTKMRLISLAAFSASLWLVKPATLAISEAGLALAVGIASMSMALRLAMHLNGDDSRSFLEQTHHLVLIGELRAERVRMFLHVAEVLRNNAFATDTPITELVEQCASDVDVAEMSSLHPLNDAKPT